MLAIQSQAFSPERHIFNGVTAFTNSIAYCRQVSRRSGSTFRFAFRVLPTDQQDAMHALYAYFRISDDLGDDESLGTIEERRAALADWRRTLAAALQGEYSHPIHPALHWAVERFCIPHRYLNDVLDGVECDLQSVAIANFEELQRYCYRVASVVGLACIRVWGLNPGFNWADAEPLAIEAGYAFQLTNILRDLREDSERGRVYLPADELARFCTTSETWTEPSQQVKLRELLRLQVERAKGYYTSSSALGAMLQPRGRAVHELMVRAYSGILDRIVAKDYDVFTRRIRLSKWAKLKLLSRIWLTKRND
jgi:phytoene synthase